MILSLFATDMNLSSSEPSIFWKRRQPALLLLTVLELRIEQNSLLHNAASLHPGMRWRSFAKQWSKLFLILLHHLTWDENIAFISHNNIDVRWFWQVLKLCIQFGSQSNLWWNSSWISDYRYLIAFLQKWIFHDCVVPDPRHDVTWQTTLCSSFNAKCKSFAVLKACIWIGFASNLTCRVLFISPQSSCSSSSVTS